MNAQARFLARGTTKGMTKPIHGALRKMRVIPRPAKARRGTSQLQIALRRQMEAGRFGVDALPFAQARHRFRVRGCGYSRSDVLP